MINHTYQTYYKVVNSEGVAIIDRSPKSAAGAYVCFAAYNLPNTGFTGKNTLFVYLLKEGYCGHDPESPYGILSQAFAENIFNHEEICQHCKTLNDAGFPMIMEESEKYYTFILKEEEYKCWVHVKIALDYLRMLWEGNLNKGLVEFFKICKPIRDKYNNFELLQIITIKMGVIGSCHYTPSGQRAGYPERFYILPKTEMFEEFKKEPYVNNADKSTYSFWRNIANRKFNEFCAKVKKPQQSQIKPELVKELKELVLDSDRAVKRAYQICNPRTFKEIRAAKNK